MPPTPLNIGVIGLGKMGLLHAGLANALAGSRLAGVADESAAVLDAFRAVKPQVSTFRDYTRLLDAPSLDAVFITSPTSLHVPMALECLARKISFFLEKPLAPCGADAVPLVRALARQPVTNMVGFMSRYVDVFRRARHIVKSGALGALVHFKATMYVSQLFRTGKGWRYDKRVSGGGVLITQNSHLIDLLMWFFGPVSWVSAHTKSRYSKTVEDFAHAYIKFASGLSGYIDTSWSVRHHRTVEITVEVHGENGTLAISGDSVKLFLDEQSRELPSGWSLWRKPDIFAGVELDIGGPEYTRQDADFLNAVSARSSVECDVLSAFRVQQVIDAAYSSASRSGAPVSLEEEPQS